MLYATALCVCLLVVLSYVGDATGSFTESEYIC